ncbi:hypothetical protein NP493_4g07037 [Ridgeia piscesae]|uniref:CC2D2A N-terminal C2 domain-containing protein n=1 Tax=Ridgeia piscesae TaxID=27915 RepID=A0AAD9PFQ7_RIDPI|nr:hypothetical protein NP493_4g07037 [Ridgeia piscesae]
MWRSQKQLVKFLRQKLTAVKRAEKHVQDSLARIAKEKRGDNKELHFRLTEYQDEIKLTRHSLEAEMRADRILLKNIIKTWKEIKSLRETDKCINTSLKLIIKKEPTNKAADTAEWERDVDEEVEEVKREVDEEHRAAMAVYKEKLDVWKTQRARKKEAKKRQKQRSKRPESETETNQDIEQAEKDRAILDEFEITKPEKPQQVTAADLRDRILQKYDEIRRKPGEPMLYPELSNGASITATKQCPSKEQQRRADVNRYKVYVRITFNNKEVSRTPARLLGQDFTVHFAQIFNVEIVQWPESIKIEIFETAGLTSTLLAEVYAPIPDVNMTGDNVLLNELEFSSSQKISHTHAGVGSDVQMTFAVCEEDQQVSTLLTSGTLTTSVSWAVSSDGKALVPPVAPRSDQLQGAMAAVDIISALGMAGMTDMDKLIKWISQARLDPNDPSNADLMYLLRVSP